MDYETPAAARAAALGECGAGCSVVLTFNRCGAYAADQDAGSRAESYDLAASARQAALAECASCGRYRGTTVRAGWERLGGSPARGQFNTPLATLHPFNGWADKFLVTPADGLDDLYVRMIGDAGRVRWTVSYHDFSAATGNARHGRELVGTSSLRSLPHATMPTRIRPTQRSS